MLKTHLPVVGYEKFVCCSFCIIFVFYIDIKVLTIKQTSWLVTRVFVVYILLLIQLSGTLCLTAVASPPTQIRTWIMVLQTERLQNLQRLTL